SNVLHISLTTELTFRSYFTRHSGYFRGERVELIHHCVDGVLKLQNFAAHVHRNLAREIAIRHSGGHSRDVTDLARQVTGHRVDAASRRSSDLSNVLHIGLAAELTFRSDFARHAGYFRGERVKLIHHGVDGVLQLQNFTAHIHRDLARK